MKISKTEWWIITGIGVAALSVGGYFIWKKRSKTDKYGNPKHKAKGSGISGGVQTTREGRAATLDQPNWNNPYDMNYEQDVKAWVAPKKIMVLKPDVADTYAKQLKAADGGAWYKDDNEKAVAAVFAKKLKDKVAVATLSGAFWNVYKKDMWQYLSGFLNHKEMERYVHGPVRKLPNYRTAN